VISALHRQADLRGVVLPDAGTVDCVGDSLCNPPCCRKRRPRQNTNKSRFVSIFSQDLADQRLVNLVRRLCKHEGEPGDGTSTIAALLLLAESRLAPHGEQRMDDDGMTSMKRRLAAILAADIAGYSRLMGEDEAATVRDPGGGAAAGRPLRRPRHRHRRRLGRVPIVMCRSLCKPWA
jgi:hypothetical protein